MKWLLLTVIIAGATAGAFAQENASSTEGATQPRKKFCLYEDKQYSEGAVLRVSDVQLVCVSREWGVMMNKEKDLLWEPITSERIATYLEVSGLRAKKK